jgi:hypothetical protein
MSFTYWPSERLGLSSPPAEEGAEALAPYQAGVRERLRQAQIEQAQDAFPHKDLNSPFSDFAK